MRLAGIYGAALTGKVATPELVAGGRSARDIEERGRTERSEEAKY